MLSYDFCCDIMAKAIDDIEIDDQEAIRRFEERKEKEYQRKSANYYNKNWLPMVEDINIYDNVDMTD